MRTIPNMAVIQPGSGIETEAAVEYLVHHVGPAYLRLTRQKVKEIYDDVVPFEFGKGVRLREGTDVALVASGATVEQALGAADLLAKHGIEAAVVNIHTIQPIDSRPARGRRAHVRTRRHRRGPRPGRRARRGGVRGACGAVSRCPCCASACAGSANPVTRRSCTRSSGCPRRRSPEATAGFCGSPAEVALAGDRLAVTSKSVAAP